MEQLPSLSKKIAIIGECMIELSGQPFAQQEQNFGGDTLNTAIYLSRLLPRLAPAYITALGLDNYSHYMVDAWQKEGINCDYVLRETRKLPGMYAIEIDPNGERSFHYWRNDSAARQMCDHPQFRTAIDYMKSCDLVYLSGISLAILPDHGKIKLLEALAEIRSCGVKIAIDSNYRPRLWRSRMNAKEWMMQLYSLADLALVTAEDEDLLHGSVNSLPSVIAKRLQGQGVEQVVVKMGKEGAQWFELGQSDVVAGNQVDNVIDTTAAGDSFNAAYLASWALGMSMSESCHWGNQLAAQVIQHKGAVIPTAYTRYLTELMDVNYDD
ncbi:sugar kinase [Photobacterium damselae]|uniref:sugar kinase n=1 Tax=Photobacterium damselae TaxID=38293 RepID=UPI00083B90C4|nr:sugar kinase [Photobacterium damselae]MCG9778872.1 sugar kinase [Photobacterium damselae]NVO60838.1 sugar kinase [Photobacterium damselae subsp. damselae]ODA24037.1 ketodeoxygluconokinase [Photobacterium damselae subsp. damselae]OEC81776.1 ketodeoxygluconokinase [Photobacterium damselae subsp. damselae]PSB87741.1 sugar kinase [Photobacterium damselae subsp. damselae]